MRIVQVTMAPLKPDGGLSLYVREVSRRLAEAGHEVTVVGHGRPGVAPEVGDRAGGLTWKVVPLDKGYATRVTPATVGALREALAGADVVHLQGMRTKLNAVASRLARQARVPGTPGLPGLPGVPVVVSPHGQVHPWLMGQRWVRKRLVDWMWDRPIYRRAAMGLAMSPDEQDHLARFMPRLPSRWLPIGIDPAAPVSLAVRQRMLAETPALALPRRRLLYLAPLNERKGYDLLVDAYRRIKADDSQLVIAGPDSDATHQQLRERLSAWGVSPAAVVHLPRMTAAERDVLLGLAWAFVAPSRSENFGIVVTEALAAGVPVLTTTGTPWGRLDPSGTVMVVEPTAEALAEGMQRLLAETPPEHQARIDRGHALVQQKFAWPGIIEQLTDLYQEVIDRHRAARR